MNYDTSPYCKYPSAEIKKWFLGFYCLVFLSLVSEKVAAQRVYATAEQHSAKLAIPPILVTPEIVLGEVQNASRAVDTPYTNFSTLFTTLGALALIEAWQNLQFGTTPLVTTPVIIKYGANNALLGLVNGTFIQPTNNGVLVSTTYSNSTLLALLGIGVADAEIMLPAPNVSYNGIRLRVSSTLLGAAITAKYYYAFFIAHPTVSNQSICSGTNATITISNPQPNYTYRLFSSATGGTELQTTIGSTFTISGLATGTHTYYVEATEPGATAYRSGRTPVTITVNPLPSISVTTPIYACEGGAMISLPYSALVNNPTTYSIVWSGNNSFNPVSNNPLPANTIPITIPATTSVGVYNGVLTVRNSSNGTQCNSVNNNFSIIIQAHPNATPVLTSFQ